MTKHDDRGSEISGCGMDQRLPRWLKEGGIRVAVANPSNPKQWNTLGTSPTLACARKALIFYIPIAGYGIS